MKKKYMIPLQRIAELDPKDGILLEMSYGEGEDGEDSSKVKEESHSFNSNGNIWDKEW